MESHLGRARAVLYGALGAGALFAAPTVGWWVLLPLLVAICTYQVVRTRLRAARRPEYWVFAQILLTQVLLGVCIACSDGPDSPLLALGILPLITLPARFGTGGIWGGGSATVVAITAATLGVHPQATFDNPVPTMATLVVVIGLTAFSDLLQRTEMRQRSRAVLDPLTGLLNRHGLESRFVEIAEQARQADLPVSLVLCDIDHFKQINDGAGHAAGDEVLRTVAQLLRTHTRMFELIYRYGGDELLLVLPGSGRTAAMALANRIREEICHRGPNGVDVTLSVGVASAIGDAVALDTLFAAADRALYEAKAAGRNQVVSGELEDALPVAA